MRRLAVLLVTLSAGLTLAPAASTDSQTNWKKLHRPFHLPALGAGGKCPLSKPANEIRGDRFGVEGAIGPGPVYPILSSASLLTHYQPDQWGPGPWAGQKVLWFVHQRYRGPVLIRGRRLGGWEWMRFDNGSRPKAEIRLEPGETVSWTGQPKGSRGRPSSVRVRTPGCYAAQIDGTTFSRIVVFLVDITEPA